MTDFKYHSPSPYNPGHLHVQNREARGLIEFAIDTARAYEEASSDAGEIRRISAWYENQFWDGMGVDVAELFPDIASRRFWCRVFFDVARRVFRRELGNRDVCFWQANYIGNAVIVGRMLLQAAKDVDPKWEGPVPLDWADEAAWSNQQQARGNG
jgi:hypothetical protein